MSRTPGPSSSPPPASLPASPPRPSATRRGPDAALGPVLTGALRHSSVLTTAACLFSVASAGAAVALPAVLGHTLDLVLDSRPGGQAAIALCAVLLIAEVLLDALVALTGGVTTARSTAWLRRRGIDHLMSLAPHRVADHFTPGDLVTRLTGNAADAGTAPTTVATGLAALITPIGALIALALTDIWLAAVFLAGLPLLTWLLRTFARGSSDSVRRYQRVQADIATRLVEALGGARTIAAAGTERRERTRVLTPLRELGAQGRHMWQIYGRAVVSSSILVPLLTTAVLAVGGIRLAHGSLTVGELLAASRYAALTAGLGGVVGQLNALVRSRAAAHRTGELLALPPVPHGSRPLPADGRGRLELRAVTVVRGGAAVLRGVDLVVPGGVTMAVVGHSGAGKSLLAAVAGRLTDPDSGQVLLDGVPLSEADPAQLRREIGYAFERPVLFGETVGEAIGFGPYEPPAHEIEAASRAAGADSFLRLLPDGCAAPLTRAPLSGGEVQRLGLARAFAHAGRLLVLDDATSSLDSVTELHVSRALVHDVRTGSRLLIAHRVSSAARADLVAWMEHGRIRAVAPHDRLWADPDYRAVFAHSGDEDTRAAS
ncbi:ABC transporter ATP-binding protein [Streptomyces inhibens]|uniref:ABC transporter ATP-binding protein n=1 Tax=Streptomyces inhibens TaxID=2293571 RepID=UPI001EE75428|nr:ABC transporter ATP-binding protein [Streptomyces inhibens]UKY47542.1 ABC transporter ATP-binding protein/permease [Streptomyces inhibens]